jgi:lipopolysaccharide export system protein LptA
MMRSLRGLAGVAVLGALAGPALGQSLDLSQGGPIEITATDGIEWRQQDQAVIARGDARATRGAVAVESDRLIARYPDAGHDFPAPIREEVYQALDRWLR